MKQVASIISIYSADISGVASALFELGGMTVMHDASGCNSTYNTHDEPRWYDMDSMVFISGMTEMDAILGDDHKLINDVKSAAEELSPKFIALAGTPIPMMMGTDFKAIAKILEKKTGIICFGINTNSMHSYFRGAGMAFAAVAERLVEESLELERDFKNISVNILGLTPLDFSVNGTDESIRNFLDRLGFSVVSSWAMGDTLENIKRSAAADVNLVVSSSGMEAARVLEHRFGIPYVLGLPCGNEMSRRVGTALKDARETKENIIAYMDEKIQVWEKRPLVVFIGEYIINVSLAESIEADILVRTRVISPLDTENEILRSCDFIAEDETDIIPLIRNASVVVADPLYRFIVPDNIGFVSMPHEAFSGRMYRDEIKDMIKEYESIFMEIKKFI